MDKTSISVRTERAGGYTLSDGSFELHSGPPTIRIDGEALTGLNFEQQGEYPAEIGDAPGNVRADETETAGIGIARELFVGQRNRCVAVRFAVENRRNERVRFDGMKVLDVTGEESLRVGGGPMAEWKVLRYPFHKNDIPSYFRPTTIDKDFEDAVFSCIDAVPGEGVLYNRMNADTRTITSGPVTILRNIERPGAPLVMLCTMGIEKHFMEVFLTTTDDRQHLANFHVDCNFDGMALDPGENVRTHWLFITTGVDESELLETYTETVAGQYGLPPVHQKPLNVFCSWYFYTWNLTERHLLDELETIRQRNIPVDVFQIDDGWMDDYGSYRPDRKKFPSGMAYAAEQIREAGLMPGIWACPFVIEEDSPVLEKYPGIHQVDAEGEPIIYDTSINNCYVVDPTAPGAEQYFREIFSRFKEWGFTYFKLDWLRAMYEFDTVRFRDPKVNRAMAYSMAMRQIREIIGPECYITGCGGLSDPGNFGMVNAQRTCKDVRGIWEGPKEVHKSGALVHIKQNVLRNYINRFYHLDPDATQIRRRHEPFFEDETRCPVGVYQSEGHYTEEEAFTICAQQYLSGGLTMISERFPDLGESRMALLRHIVPSMGLSARIIDFATPVCPTLFLTEVEPECSRLGRWWTLAVANWEDHPVTRTIRLEDVMRGAGGERFVAFEFRTQQVLGLFGTSDAIEVKVPVHGIRLLRLTPWGGDMPTLLGTDLHLTGGGCEIAEWDVSHGAVEGSVCTEWQYPVVLTAGLPTDDGDILVKSCTVPLGKEEFRIARTPVEATTVVRA